MTELLLKLYPIALECSISGDRYWDMALSEISAEITAFRAREKARLKERCLTDYVLAVLIARGVRAPKFFPDFKEAYSFLDDKSSDDTEDWKMIKANISAYGRARKEAADCDS